MELGSFNSKYVVWMTQRIGFLILTQFYRIENTLVSILYPKLKNCQFLALTRSTTLTTSLFRRCSRFISLNLSLTPLRVSSFLLILLLISSLMVIDIDSHQIKTLFLFFTLNHPLKLGIWGSIIGVCAFILSDRIHDFLRFLF